MAGQGAFAERLRAGERLVGTVLTFADPALGELAAAPFDFAWIDLEHGALTVRDALGLAIAVRAAGCAALVRLPRADGERLGALLDAGVDGVVAPRVETSEAAAALTSRLRHPPDGTRGFAHRRADAWGRAPHPPRPSCLLQIESSAAVAAAPALARVEGVDALVVGPADLALDLGVGPGLGGAELAAAVRAVQDAAAGAGIASGVAAGGEADALLRVLGGRSRILVYSADARLYAAAVDVAAATARRAVAAREEVAR